MPKKLRIWPNGRLDIPDFIRAANEYTAETAAFSMDRLWLDRRAEVLEGFRIQIDDQTANPGQITVYNGTGVNRSGQLLNEESLATSSVTLTLTGASTTFYLELELVESDSDTDARAFMDPTYDNGGPPVPDGREVSLSVATRITPTWRIVRPVSTTGFQASTNPNSNRIPLAVLSTNVSNEITGAVNPGLVTSQPSTTTETDVLAGVTAVRCFDVRTFEVGDTITIGFGGATPDTGRVISSVDAVNGIINFAPALANAHQAGAIVRRTAGGSANIVVQNDDPTRAAVHPDYLPRLFQGNETRGSALASSADTFGAVNDLSLRSMKDYIDYLSAQIRELKFGSMRRDATDGEVPTAFDSPPRYFDPAGGVQGARGHTISIGDGINSFGDFNGTDETPFIAAVAALASFTPATGRILVKNGTYTFANPVVLTDRIAISGTSRDATIIVNNSTSGAFSINAAPTDLIELSNLQIQAGTSAVHVSIDGDSRNFINNCLFVSGHITHSATGFDSRTYVRDTRFNGNYALFGADLYNVEFFNCQIGVVTAVAQATTTITGVTFSDCTLSTTTYVVNCPNATNVRITDCTVTASLGLLLGGLTNWLVADSKITVGLLVGLTASSTGLTVDNCDITSTSSLIANTLGATVANSKISDCRITTTTNAANALVLLSADDVYGFAFTDNVVSATFTGTSSGVPGEFFNLGGSVTANLEVHNNSISILTGAYVDFLTVGGSSVLTNSAVTGNEIGNIARVLNQTSGSSVDTLHIKNNNISYTSMTTGTTVFDLNTASTEKLVISGNTLLYTNSSGVLRGLNIVSAVLLDNVVFDNNVVDFVSSSLVYGVSSITSLPAASKMSVCGNSFKIQGVSIASAVELLSGTTNTLRCSNNTIDVNCTSAGTANGIFISNNAVITGNRIHSVISTGGTATGITSSGLVASNDLIGVESGNASLACYGINAQTGSTVLYNTVDMSSTTGLNIGIYNPTSSVNVTISSNRVICGTLTNFGIYALPGAATSNLTISNNLVTGLSRASTAGGIDVRLLGLADENILIANNHIIETVFNELHRGIQVEAIGLVCDNVSITGNSVQGITPTAARNASSGNGIRVQGVQNFNITANTVHWAGNNANGVNGIVADQSNVGVINSNRVTPSSSVSYDEILLSSTDNVLIHGNYVGDGVITGSINTGGGANITNTDNKTL